MLVLTLLLSLFLVTSTEITAQTDSCALPKTVVLQAGYENTLQVPCIQEGTKVQLEVFNRWGMQVYQSKDYKNDWNGKKDGKPLKQGVYFYRVERADGRQEQGHLTII